MTVVMMGQMSLDNSSDVRSRDQVSPRDGLETGFRGLGLGLGLGLEQ